jgi:hypothetical protein
VARLGQDVLAATGGRVTNVGYPYGDDLSFRYVEITTNDGYVVREFYVQPVGASDPDGAYPIGLGHALGGARLVDPLSHSFGRVLTPCPPLRSGEGNDASTEFPLSQRERG